MSHDTYVVLSPSRGTVRTRCPCGWAGDEKKIAEFVLAVNQEIEHLAQVVYELEGVDVLESEPQ